MIPSKSRQILALDRRVVQAGHLHQPNVAMLLFLFFPQGYCIQSIQIRRIASSGQNLQVYHLDTQFVNVKT